jgi:centractin
LPDGQAIKIGPEKFRAPEVLFTPERIGIEYPGVQELLVNSINRADLDLRRDLFSSIYLAGGSTMFTGFPERLLNELRRLSAKDTKIRINAPDDRKISCWLGGSILSSLGAFKHMWIRKQDYEEEGKRVLHSKTI